MTCYNFLILHHLFNSITSGLSLRCGGRGFCPATALGNKRKKKELPSSSFSRLLIAYVHTGLVTWNPCMFSTFLARLPSPKGVFAFSIWCNLPVYTLRLNVIELVKQNCIDCLSTFYMPKFINLSRAWTIACDKLRRPICTCIYVSWLVSTVTPSSAKLGPLFWLFLRRFWRSKNALA